MFNVTYEERRRLQASVSAAMCSTGSPASRETLLSPETARGCITFRLPVESVSRGHSEKLFYIILISCMVVHPTVLQNSTDRQVGDAPR